MGHRPLFLAAAVYAAFLLVLTVTVPSFPLENRTVRALRSWEEGGLSVSASGVVTESRVTALGSLEVTLRRAVIRAGGETVRVKRLLIYPEASGTVPMSSPAGAQGQEISLTGRYAEVSGLLNISRMPTVPGQFNTYLYDRLRGCPFRLGDARLVRVSGSPRGVTGILAVVRAAGVRRLESVFPDTVSGFLAAVIFGERGGMDEEETQLWRQAGAAHILAISGLHLTLIGMGLFALFGKMHLSKTAAALLTGVLMTLYALMTGFSLPTIRALIMFLYAAGARIAGRPPDRPTAAALAGLLILLEDPAYLLDAGFQLSFAAVAALGLSEGRSRLGTAIRLFFLPLPLVLRHYFELPLFGFLVNLILVPLMPALLLFGIAGTALGGAAAYPASGLVFLIKKGLTLLGSASPLTFITGRPSLGQILLYEGVLAGVLLAVHRNRRSRKRFAAYLTLPLLVLLLIKRPPDRFVLTMLDVGQGDGFVLETPDGRVLMVDAGSSSVERAGRDRLIPFLKYEGIRRVDYLFVTHMDEDHISGVRELFEAIAKRRTSIRVKTFILPYRGWGEEALAEGAAAASGTAGEEARAETAAEAGEREEAERTAYGELAALAREAGARIFVMAKGDSLRLPSGRADKPALSVEVLGPDPAVRYRTENAASLILSLSYGQFGLLMTGDAAEEGEEALAAALDERGADQSYEVLKAAHHGSKYSTPETLLDRVAPQVTLISCGYHNLYGHPHKELLERLRSHGSAISRTDRDGTVRVLTDGVRYEVRTFVPETSAK